MLVASLAARSVPSTAPCVRKPVESFDVVVRQGTATETLFTDCFQATFSHQGA